MPFQVTMEKLPAGVCIATAGDKDTVSVLMTEFVSTEDGQLLIERLEGFVDSALRLLPQSKRPLQSQVDHLLMIVHRDRSAVLYVNELSLISRMRTNRAVKKGEQLGIDDITDIVDLDVGVAVPADAGVMFFVSHGWRRGLYYDWRPLAPRQTQRRTDDVRVVFAQIVAHLMFQEFHSLTEDDWSKMFTEQWFPFKSLKRETLLGMRKRIRSGSSIDELLPEIGEQVVSSIDSWVETWARDDALSSHTPALALARDHFLNGDYLSAIHLIYPRIEGILRTNMQAHNVRPNNQEGIAEHASRTLAHLPRSLLLPRHFTRYLKDVYFANFDPKDPLQKVTRNTIGHGVASIEECNEKAAIIGLLIARHLSLCLCPSSTK